MQRKNDPFRGIINGLTASLIFWVALILWAAIFFFNVHV
jgi:hypothetical protein